MNHPATRPCWRHGVRLLDRPPNRSDRPGNRPHKLAGNRYGGVVNVNVEEVCLARAHDYIKTTHTLPSPPPPLSPSPSCFMLYVQGRPGGASGPERVSGQHVKKVEKVE